MVRISSLLTALWATSATCIRIRSISHSGKACPQDSRVTWTGEGDELIFSFHGFSETLEAGSTTHCQVHMLVEDGEPGRALLLDDVTVRGGLHVSANTKADFYTVAFWSENAADTATKETSISTGSSSLSRNVAIPQGIQKPSSCIDRDGYIGLLNVNFRIVSQGRGSVAFGRERVTGRPVTETLKFRWQSC